MGVLFWGLGLLTTYLAFKIVGDTGLFKVVYTHHPGPCKLVNNIDGGSEDIVLIPTTSYALISSGVFMHWAKKSTVKDRGDLYLYNIEDSVNKAEKLKISGSKGFVHTDFFPTGLSVFKLTDNKFVVFAINTKTHNVEKFELFLSEKKLSHVKSISDPTFRTINNIIALSPDTFYLSNWLYYFNPFLTNVEMMLKLPYGTVVYYDGTKGTEILSGLQGPNGISLTKNKKNLLVVVNHIGELHVYKLKSTTEAELTDKKNLQTALDNINLDDEGRALIGSHPVAWKILMHMSGPEKNSAPSQVIRISLDSKEEKIIKVEEIFSDEGDLIQGSTVAMAKGKKMLIGTLLHKTAICDVNI